MSRITLSEALHEEYGESYLVNKDGTEFIFDRNDNGDYQERYGYCSSCGYRFDVDRCGFSFTSDRHCPGCERFI